MAKRVTERAKLERELREAESNVGKYISRPGVHYSWFNASALNDGIEAKRDYAVKWRRNLLAWTEGAELTRRKVKVRRYDSELGEYVERTYRVYSVGGKDVCAIYTSGSDNMLDREYWLSHGESAETRLVANGWAVVS